MKTSKRVLPVVLSFVLIGACVSTTTGLITESQPDNAAASELNYQLGARYFKAGNFELARDRLLAATKFDPKMAIAYSTLALTYESLDNKRLARESYMTAVRVAPRDYHVRNAYAVFLCRESDFAEAQKHFASAASHAENDDAEVTLTNAGVCMMQKPDAAAAEVFFRQALDNKANHAEALLQLCLMKFEQQDYLGARAFLQRYMSVSASAAGILYLASRIEDMLDNDRGRKDYEDHLIREYPTSPEARKVLGAD